jgi:hypothetical protein
MTNATLEERKLRYIQEVEVKQLPPEKTWWQYPPPAYHLTKNYATQYDKPISTEEPVVIKRVRKEWMIVTIMLFVAAFLLYLVGENKFGFGQVLVLILILVVVMPRLLDNPPLIMISRDSIWFYNEKKEIPWKHVLLTNIKIAHEEKYSYSFIIHYYDDADDEFHELELELQQSESAAMLSASIEAFRKHSWTL